MFSYFFKSDTVLGEHRPLLNKSTMNMSILRFPVMNVLKQAKVEEFYDSQPERKHKHRQNFYKRKRGYVMTPCHKIENCFSIIIKKPDFFKFLVNEATKLRD